MNRPRPWAAPARSALAFAAFSLAASTLLAPLSPLPARAETPVTLLSPWTLARSGYFLQGTFSLLSSDEFYDVDGEKVSLPGGQKFRDVSTGIHLEYGIRNWLGLVAAVPVRSLHLDETAGPDLSTTGFGDFTGGLRVRLIQKPVVASAQAEVKLSTGYNVTSTTPALGAGQTDFTGRLLAGWTHSDDFPIFVQAGVGYRARMDEPANQILFNADGGIWPHERLLVVGSWEYVDHTGDGTVEDFFKAGLSARYQVLRKLEAVGGAFHMLGGQNAPAGNQFFLGVAYKGSQLLKGQGLFASTSSEAPPAPAKAPPATETPASPPPQPEPTKPETPPTPENPETPTPPPPTPPKS